MSTWTEEVVVDGGGSGGRTVDPQSGRRDLHPSLVTVSVGPRSVPDPQEGVLCGRRPLVRFRLWRPVSDSRTLSWSGGRDESESLPLLLTGLKDPRCPLYTRDSRTLNVLFIRATRTGHRGLEIPWPESSDRYFVVPKLSFHLPHTFGTPLETKNRFLTYSLKPVPLLTYDPRTNIDGRHKHHFVSYS